MATRRQLVTVGTYEYYIIYFSVSNTSIEQQISVQYTYIHIYSNHNIIILV